MIQPIQTMVHHCILIASFLLFLELAQPNSLLNCPYTCGNLTIPYPFGTKQGCYLNENFFISCNTTTPFDPPRAFYKSTNLNVTEIMLEKGHIRVWSDIAHQCYDKNGSLIAKEANQNLKLALQKFPLSTTMNKFVVVGCEAYGFFTSSTSAFTGCSSSCTSMANVVNGTCNGIGCCQMAIPKMAMGTNITLRGFSIRPTFVSSFNPCSYAFVVEGTAYVFSSVDFVVNPSRSGKLPVILDWMIGNQTCVEAKRDLASYACKANNVCYDSDNGPGYRCNCSIGYEGNPYLPNGCQDIDECKVLRPCTRTCSNLAGSHRCSCPKGYIGDGKKDGTGCILGSSLSRKLLIVLGVSVSMGSFILLLACYCLHKIIKSSMEIRRRDKNFNRNGGLLLQQQMSSHNDIMARTKIFSSRDMDKATDYFNQNRVLGQGGQGTVYKGMLNDGRIIAVKKSKSVDEDQLHQFINEVVVLSHVSHRNVVQLVGCSLETQVPLLVYEYVPNGTLYQHIHEPSEDLHLTWKMRLQISADTAGALAYLHSSSSVPVYHRDIKSSNILLDEKYKAKVSNFGISRSINVDQTHLSTCHVQGTFGYLDPEYFQSYQFTEKSDVYSFGVVLVELLTSKKPIISSVGSADHRSLTMEFLSMIENGHMFDMLDPRVLKEGTKNELQTVANLACRCLNMVGKNRPKMKEVATILEGLRSSQGNDHIVDAICSSYSPYYHASGDYFSSNNVSLEDSSALSSSDNVHPLLHGASKRDSL